ncbi:MAG: Panacea domain-containing protein [Parvibaculaceae bacterium]
MKPIVFKFSAEKALAAIHWMIQQQPGLDLHTLLKACYFADVEHLNRHGRPVFGATYKAMKFGPVPLEIYEMAKGEAIWLAEVSADKYPWRLNGYRLSVEDNNAPDIDQLSESDVECLQSGFDRSRGMTFNSRTEATHGPDWQAANLGIMSYEDMIEETENKRELVEYLRESGPYMRI